jgi:hypothetical protein
VEVSILKKVAMAFLKVPSQHSPGETEESNETSASG